MALDMLKKKAKMGGLQALIAQMHKSMSAGDGDKPTSVGKAMESSEKELNLGGGVNPEGSDAEEKGESASEAAAEGDDLQSKVKEYMKKKGGVPIKGKTVMMKADMVMKKPMIGKKKYG